MSTPTEDIAYDPLAVELLGIVPTTGRTLTAGGLLRTSARAFAARPFFYVVVVLFAYVPGAMIELAYTLTGHESQSVLGSWPARLTSAICVSFALGVILSAALEGMAERDISASAALQWGLRTIVRVFAVQWLTRLMYLVTLLPGAILFFMGKSIGGTLGALIMLVGGALVLFGCGYVYIRLSLAVPHVVNRRASVGPAVSMSWRWTKGHDLPLIGAFLAVFAALLGMACAGMLPLGLWAMLSSDASTGVEVMPPALDVAFAFWGLAVQAALELCMSLLAASAYTRLVSSPSTVDAEAIAEVFA